MFEMLEGAFVARTPAEPSSPLVVSVPHAGVGTAGFEATITPELDVRCDADLFVDRLYRIGEADGPEVYVASRLSRFVCDLNRDPDDVAPGAVPEHPAPRNADGRGFIWAVTTTGAPALARPLTIGEWRERTAIHAAYHEALGARPRARARRASASRSCVDGHSMPSRGRAGHKDPGRARADVVPGDRDGTSCAPALTAHVTRHFEARGLRRRGRTIPTRAASSPPTTAARPTASTPSRSSCAATSTWTRIDSSRSSPASRTRARRSLATRCSRRCATLRL